MDAARAVSVVPGHTGWSLPPCAVRGEASDGRIPARVDGTAEPRDTGRAAAARAGRMRGSSRTPKTPRNRHGIHIDRAPTPVRAGARPILGAATAPCTAPPVPSHLNLNIPIANTGDSVNQPGELTVRARAPRQTGTPRSNLRLAPRHPCDGRRAPQNDHVPTVDRPRLTPTPRRAATEARPDCGESSTVSTANHPQAPPHLSPLMTTS